MVDNKFDFHCWFDGACEPTNPGGHIGMGSLVKDFEMKTEFNHSVYRPAHPDNTNNVAEYGALYFVLKYLSDSNLHDSKIIIRGDSKLVVCQMSGTWKIKRNSTGKYVKGALICLDIVKKFSNIHFEWVPRDLNDECDKVSKRELEKKGIFESKRYK